MQKALVFISHVTEEKEIAVALKNLVEATFLSMIDVFVSSDPSSIKLGRKWLDEITDALSVYAVKICAPTKEKLLLKVPEANGAGVRCSACKP